MHVQPEEQAAVSKIHAAHVPMHEVWVFGSRVHGRHLRRFSDLDLAIIADKPLEISCLAALKDDFAQSDLPYRVDVVDFSTVDASFRQVITQEHEVLQMPAKSV
ncbi:MAG: nucleotidyltransferase domain-containing protein [Mariprofundaceae bacterium]